MSISLTHSRRTWRQWASHPTTLGTANNTGKKSSGNPVYLGVNTTITGSGSYAPIARYIKPLGTSMSDIQSSERTLTSYGHTTISHSRSIHQILGTHQKSTFGASLRLMKYSSFIAASCKAIAVSKSASRPVLWSGQPRPEPEQHFSYTLNTSSAVLRTMNDRGSD